MEQENCPQRQKFFCKEEWENALRDYAYRKGYPIRGVLVNIESVVTDGMYTRLEPMPMFVKEWIENNPRPKMNRYEFIHSLGERITSIEATLAKKE